MINRVNLAAEAGKVEARLKRGAPEYVARLDYAMMSALGIAPSITGAASRWGVSINVARRLIGEAGSITISLDLEG